MGKTTRTFITLACASAAETILVILTDGLSSTIVATDLVFWGSITIAMAALAGMVHVWTSDDV